MSTTAAMRKEHEQEQTQTVQQPLPPRYEQKHRIYPPTEGIDSPYTKDVYQHAFDRFLNHIKIHDLQVLLDFSPKVIKQMIIDYILFLRDEKRLKRSSIKGQLSAILYFFQINNDDFTLTIKNFKIHLPSDDSVNDDRPYTREEIAQILKDCDLRSKVVFLLLCGSGLRKGAVPGLQLRDLIPMQYNGLDVYKIKVYARTRDEYYSFTTVESRKAIKDYLDYRERCHEQLTEKAPLIREQFNKDNPFTVNAPKFVTDKAIEYLIDQALKRSGVRKPGTVHTSHGCRKYFVSTCESSPMKSLHVSMLSGHDTGIKKHYHIPSESIGLYVRS